jgi:flagellar protein FlaI
MAKQNIISTYPRVEIDFSPKFPAMKKMKDKTKINIRYALIAPFSFAHLYWDPKEFELIYKIEEPALTPQEESYRIEITKAMKEIIDLENVVEKSQDKLLDYIDQVFRTIAIELNISLDYEGYRKIYYYLCRDFVGFNEADPLLRDYFIEDVECNGVNTPVYVVHRIYRNLKTTLIYKDAGLLASFVEKLAQRSGKYVSYANPILDASLPDGSRVNATYTKDICSGWCRER